MNERGDQVQRLLATLARHADLVSEAFEGSVSGGDKTRNAGIEALFEIQVLRPYDEDSYRLNPRLREFLADYFSSYQAFQALRRVTGTMQQAKEQWAELRRLKLVGAQRDALRLQVALDESVVDMAYSIEHNLRLLHALLSTQYGNVDDLVAKLSQNRYYAQQVKLFLADVESIDAFVERVADEAIAVGLPQIRQLVTRRLGAKRLQWAAQIKDAQAVISKRLFEAKLMEARLKRLSRFALFLGRSKTIDGWEVLVDERVDPAVVRTEPLAFRPQPDVSETEPVTRGGMIAAAAKLPIASQAKQAEEPEQQWMLADEENGVEEVLEPQQVALRELVELLRVSAQQISLLAWKDDHPELAAISDEAWLTYAGLQLRGEGCAVEYLQDAELDPFPINETFYDIQVRTDQRAV